MNNKNVNNKDLNIKNGSDIEVNTLLKEYNAIPKKDESKSNFKLLITILFMVLINIGFIALFRNLISSNYFLAIIILMVIVDTFLHRLIKGIRKTNNQRYKKNKDTLIRLMENMDYIEAMNEEVFETDEISSEEETIEYNEQIQEISGSVNLPPILKPKELIFQGSIYNSELDMIQYCDTLWQYVADNGLQIDKTVLREFFSSMAATQMMMINHTRSDVSIRFLEILNDYIGGEIFVDHEDLHWNTFHDLFSGNNQIGKCIESANNSKNIIHLMVLEQVNLSNLKNYFSKIIDYTKNPLLPCSIEEIGLDIIELPKNIWFLLIPKKLEETKIPNELIECSTIIDINARIDTPKEKVYQNTLKLAYPYFVDTIRDIFEDHFLSEDVWKKVDQIESYVAKQIPFTIDNRVFRQLERFTSMYMLCGGHEIEALDSALATKLLFMISELSLEENSDQGSILDLFDKLIGLDNLSKSVPLIKQMQEDNNL